MKAVLVVFIATWGVLHATNDTRQQNLTKRGVNDQLTYFTDPIQVRFVQAPLYRDVAPAPTNTPPHLLIGPKVVEADYSKQVALQQVLYDYPTHQMHTGAPTNGVPDHVQAPTHLLNHQPNIVTPIQHGAVINHGQGYPKYVYPVAVPQTNTPVYPYANKLIYPRPNLYPQQSAPVVTQKPFKPSPLIYISKPIVKPTPVKDEFEEDVKPKKFNRKEEEDNNEELENYEEDEEDDDRHGKYNKYEDDEEDVEVHGRYKDEDEEDDTRSYSRNVRRKTRKPSSTKKPKSYHRSYRYTSYSKPKKDVLESRQTQTVPVIHKHNSFRQEKWIVTKKD